MLTLAALILHDYVLFYFCFVSSARKRLGCVNIEIQLKAQITLFLIMADALLELNAANYENSDTNFLRFFMP